MLLYSNLPVLVIWLLSNYNKNVVYIKGVMMMRHVVRLMENLIVVVKRIYGGFGKSVISADQSLLYSNSMFAG